MARTSPKRERLFLKALNKALKKSGAPIIEDTLLSQLKWKPDVYSVVRESLVLKSKIENGVEGLKTPANLAQQKVENNKGERLEATHAIATVKSSGQSLKRARLRERLSQTDVASRIGVSQALVSKWEKDQSTISKLNQTKLKNFLGEFEETEGSDEAGKSQLEADEVSAFGAWLRRTRTTQNMSVLDLSEQSKVSVPAIYNIESGKSINPQRETRQRIAKALNKEIPSDIAAEAEEAAEIEGLGSLIDFDPYDESNLPKVAGVYVFYDISDRPVYVGKAGQIAKRVRDHGVKFWFRKPIVDRAAFIQISEERLRHQVEQVLIKFLKSNAVLNRQSVEWGSSDEDD